MFYCNNCNEIFAESEARGRKPRLEDSMSPWEWIAICPYCGSEELEEAGTCERCGEPIPPGHYYCEACNDDLHFIVDHAIGEVGGDYDKAKYVLFDYLEREWL